MSEIIRLEQGYPITVGDAVLNSDGSKFTDTMDALKKSYADKADELKEAMQNLPDGQAVSAQVAQNVTKLSELEREVGDLNQSLNGGNIQSVELDGIYLPNGKVTAIYGQKTFYARIVKGQTLTLDIVRVSGYEIATIRTGVFSSVPVLDAQAFSYSSTTDSQIVYHATDDVYFAFSIYGSYLASATFSVDSLFVTEKEFLPIKESVESITDVIGTPQKEITMVSGFYLIGSASVGSILSDKIYSNASYRCAKIACHEGDVFILSAGAGSSAGIYAFTDSDKKILVKYANDTMPLGKAEIVAPSGASFLFLNDNTNSVSFKGKGDKVSILNEVVGAIGKHNSVLDAFTLSANASKTLPLVYVRKNVTISASASAFTEIRVGVGYASYKGAWIEVDATNVKVYDYISSATQVTSYPHGLNLANGAEINIVSSKETASIIIVDAFGGVSKIDNVAWWGGGAAFITNLGNSDINGTISFNASDVSEGIWMFGDSYFSYNQTARWTHYMLEWGFDKWLANHLPGVASAVSLACFKNLVKLGKPSYIVWCLGMNDQSDANATTPNAEWLSSVNSVLSYCDANGVIPILATIPTSKNNDGTGLKYNEGKNAWVRASGRRYIDFAKAVGASGDGTWRSGLKASDIHPSEAGAKVLASQVLVDFGEITKR